MISHRNVSASENRSTAAPAIGFILPLAPGRKLATGSLQKLIFKHFQHSRKVSGLSQASYLAELAIDNEPLFEPLASVHNGARCDGAHRRIVVRSRQPLQPVEGAGMVVRQLAQVRVFDEP